MTPEWRRPGPDDGPALAALRVAAMRPSLEAVGRFDADRARDRFLRDYDPSLTETIHADGRLAGLLAVRLRPDDRNPDHLWLDHLYIHPDFAHRGLGSAAVRRVQHRAQALGLPVRLGALKQSPANGFYRAHGFRFEREEPWDTCYVWP